MVSVEHLAEHIKGFLAKDWDYIIAVSGPAGVGKSTLMQLLAPYLDKKFSYEHTNLYSQKKFTKALKQYPEKSFINVDEAINALFKRDFAKGGQKELLKALDIVRHRNLCLAFLIPYIWDLDSKVLNSNRLKIWIYIDKRGVGYIFKPDRNPFNPDPWNRDLNRKLLAKWNEGLHPNISPNYVDEIHFKAMPEEEYAKYKANKAEQTAIAATEEEKDTEEDVRRSIIYRLADLDMPKYKIAQAVKASQATIDMILKGRKNVEEEPQPDSV